MDGEELARVPWQIRLGRSATGQPYGLHWMDGWDASKCPAQCDCDVLGAYCSESRTRGVPAWVMSGRRGNVYGGGHAPIAISAGRVFEAHEARHCRAAINGQ